MKSNWERESARVATSVVGEAKETEKKLSASVKKKKTEKAAEYNSINRTRQKETEIMSFLVSWTNEFVCTSY